jgi:hypothetical protein
MKAQEALQRKPPDSSAAARLVASDPLAPGALTLQALARAQLGETAPADAAMSVAGAHLPIDLLAHSYLFERALRVHDVSAALAELDISLRARPYTTQAVAGAVARLLRDLPDAEAEFARLLARGPLWRRSLLEGFAALKEADPADLQRIYARMRALSSPPTAEEMRFLLQRFLRDGRVEEAYLAWLDHLPREGLERLGLLYNADFSEPVENMPFDWELAAQRGAEITVTTAEDGAKALQAEFFGSRAAITHARHLLTLAPGDYVFSGLAEARGLETERGLRWRLACHEEPNGEIGVTPLLQGSRPAQPFRVEFTVPAEGCATQILQLELPARIGSEQQILGAARYARLALERRRR